MSGNIRELLNLPLKSDLHLGNSKADFNELKQWAIDIFTSYDRFITLSFKGQCETQNIKLYKEFINYMLINMEHPPDNYLFVFELYSDNKNFHSHGLIKSIDEKGMRKLLKKWCELKGINYSRPMIEIRPIYLIEKIVLYVLKDFELMKKLNVCPMTK